MDALAAHSELIIKQTRRGWCQECMGCEAKTEFNVLDASKNKVFYIIEESSCCMRFCCGNARPFEMRMHAGADDGAPLVAHYDKPFTCCPPGACSFCCKHHIFANTADGARLGKTEEACYICTPTLDVFEGDTKMYSVEKAGCCRCVVFECCRQPFDIKDASGSKVGAVIKKFGGLQEFYTDADTFQVKFPGGSNAAQKVILIGSVMLLNQLFFESEKKDSKPDGAPPTQEMER